MKTVSLQRIQHIVDVFILICEDVETDIYRSTLHCVDRK